MTDVVSDDFEEREVKIATKLAEQNSPYILQLLGQFDEVGPNGVHKCLVYQPMGGSVADGLNMLYGHLPLEIRCHLTYPKWMVKTILRDVLIGLSHLHHKGIVHGDLQPGNMLFTANDLDGLEESELKQKDIKKSTQLLKRLDGKEDKWAPQYLVRGQDLSKHSDLSKFVQVKLSDFGGAFFKTRPPTHIVTPLALRAPETILGAKVDEKIDIWAFGCLMYEFLTDESLFKVNKQRGWSQSLYDNEQLVMMHDVLGEEMPPVLMCMWARSCDIVDREREGLNAKGRRVYDALEVVFDEKRTNEVDDYEAKDITNLLRRIFRYEPADRPTAAELLQEEWFSGA